jgi:carbon monoxide dehydrogenase subunit G
MHGVHGVHGMRVRAHIEIAAPPDRVFAFFDDVANASLLLPNFVGLTSVEPLASGGRRLEYTVRTKSGGTASVISEHIEYEPPRRTVSRASQSGMEMTSVREFAETARGTRVTATVRWKVWPRYVGPIVTLPVRGPLRRSLRATLEAAKVSIER